nr:hypothetical protein [Tanacetum cinerariifolium]
MSANDKTSLGYDSQLSKNEMRKCEIFKNVSDSSVSEINEDNNQAKDRYKVGIGYHAAPPPYTGNYMPPRADLSFTGLDDSVFKFKISETRTSVNENESITSKSSEEIKEEPKTVSNDNLVKSVERTKKYISEKHTNNHDENLRKRQDSRDDWKGINTQKQGIGFEFNKRACFVCGSVNHLIKDYTFYKNKMVEKSVINNKGKSTGQREVRPVWNNAKRVNHQNFSKMIHPHPKRNFVPITIATKSGQVLVNVAKQNSAASTNTARPKVNTAKSSYFKSHFPKRRHFNQRSAAKNNTFSKKFTAKGKNVTTVGPKAVVNAAKGKKETAVKSLAEYQEINGGFVAFGGSPKGGKITEKGDLTCLFAKATIDESNLWHRRVGHINFKTLNKLVTRNLVRVIKPHNKTPYELLIGRSPNLEFMRPFGCPVNILNTLDHLGKFDGKANKGFLVGYSVNSKAFRVFYSRTRKVKENMYVNFLENKPNVAGSGPEWLFDIDSLTKSMNYKPVSVGNQSNGDVGIQTDIHAGQASQEKAAGHEYILLPFISSNPPLSSTIQSSDVNASDQPEDVNAGDIQGDVEEILRNDDVCQGNEIRIDSSTIVVNADSTSINTASNIIDAGSLNINTADSNHTNMPTLEATGIFDGAFDDKDLGAEADTNNLDSSTVFSPIPITRMQKDHPKEHIIGDPNLNTQTRRMINFSKETAMVSFINRQKRTNHKDFQNCLFACFLSQMETKKDIWTLVYLPYGKRAIGSKWLFRNKLDERGIVIRNKARLVAQGHTQEEGIDYDEVFSLVARIRLFLAYASFKAFIVYQMNVKSVFLYGKIEEEVYVCQPPRFEILTSQIKYTKLKRHCIVCIKLQELGLQVKQNQNDIFISQDKYVAEILKKFGFSKVKTVSTPMETSKPLLKDEDGQETVVENTITEAEYVAALSCYRQATAKVNKDNDQEQIQALVDKTKVIITEDNIRSDLHLDDAEGTTCLLNEEIFEGMASHKEMYVISFHTKKIFANMRKIGAGFSGPRKPRRKHRKATETSHDESEDKDYVPTPSSDPLSSAKEIAALKKKVSKLNKWRKSRSGRLRRLKKFGSVRRVKSPTEKDDLGAQEDASKHGRMIEKIDQNADNELEDETQGRINDDEMFGVDDIAGEEVVTTTGIKDSAAPTTNVIKDEITMAQALAALKSVKPKVVVQE